MTAIVDASTPVLVQLAGFVCTVLGVLAHRWGASRGRNLGDKSARWDRAAELARPLGLAAAALGALLFGAGTIVR